jgi:macrolide-specific efflux system membrane fusion protein
VQTAQAELKATQARIDMFQAQIRQAQASLRSDEAELGYTRIYAPMSGTVVAVDAREGQTLNAQQQTPLILRIAKLSPMTVWAEVSEADIGHVKPGMTAYFTTLAAATALDQHRAADPADPAQAAGSKPRAAAARPAGSSGSGGAVHRAAGRRQPDNALMAEMTTQVFFVAGRPARC